MLHRLFAFLALGLSTVAQPACADESAIDLFESRIMPIFQSPNPSSCVQCHLTAVDLKNYILPSHVDTFRSLRDQGLINVGNPSDSKILKLIEMGDRDQDELAKRIHAKARQAEFEAFAAWVHACCNDKSLVQSAPLSVDALAGPAKSVEVIRHDRKDRVLDSFVRNVWSQRMRCFPCHTPDEIDSNDPKHKKPKETHRNFVEQHGTRMNIFKATPEETMRSLLASSKKSTPTHLPLINLEEPVNSLLVLKPTSKLPPQDENGKMGKPSSVDPVSHMGGLKMHVDDVSYKAIVAWIQDLANTQRGLYESADDFPPDNWYPSKHVIRIKDVPESWPLLGRVQLFIHKHAENGPLASPIAFTQGLVTPKRFVVGNLMLMRSSDPLEEIRWDPKGVSIPAGKYTLKVYFDEHKRLEADPGLFLGEKEFIGQLTFDAKWGEGFPNAEVVSLADLSN